MHLGRTRHATRGSLDVAMLSGMGGQKKHKKNTGIYHGQKKHVHVHFQNSCTAHWSFSTWFRQMKRLVFSDSKLAFTSLPTISQLFLFCSFSADKTKLQPSFILAKNARAANGDKAVSSAAISTSLQRWDCKRDSANTSLPTKNC